ncbi:MAG TPA: hypothetical protein PK079_09465 [Leptospiraceae bacterium]|nr:hypothetical protein [Leptospiraceae bacterium]HMW06446.1 hypothetical protein [Leptospiraceae bacterium]HMX31534.1 hypothetical protein [Leptospiraceae bacterium]HMY31927.1 hypothetical protein [Leptospiraceae bacterium]HMZ63208.1 hypothetical protein [Leptospiraceae bacterium]
MAFRFFLFLIYFILLIHSIGAESKRKDALHNRKNLLSKITNENGKIFYLEKQISLSEYEEKKKKEIATFKEDLKSIYKLDFKVRYTKYYNIAYQCTEKEMDTVEHKLKVFFDDTYARYFIYEPRFTLRIIFFKNKEQFSKKMGYDSYGVYFPESPDYFTSTERTLYTYYNSGPGTLWHEMVHSFVDLNTETDVQQWFNEGFASFYEMGSVQNNKFIEGYTNWRLPELQGVIRNKKMKPLKKFLLNSEMNEDYGYSAARFLFVYLWTENKIIPFVKSYIYDLSPNYQGKELGQKAIEKLEELLGKPIDQIEEDYIKLALKSKTYEKLKQK